MSQNQMYKQNDSFSQPSLNQYQNMYQNPQLYNQNIPQNILQLMNPNVMSNYGASNMNPIGMNIGMNPNEMNYQIPRRAEMNQYQRFVMNYDPKSMQQMPSVPSQYSQTQYSQQYQPYQQQMNQQYSNPYLYGNMYPQYNLQQ